MTETVKPTRVKTGRVRASFVHIFVPRLNDLSGNDEYSLVMLIPKSDTATMDAIKKAAAAARTEKWGANAPKGLKVPWKDGDGPKTNGGDHPEEAKGCWVMGAAGKKKPGVVNHELQPVTDPNAFVSGDYCRVSLNMYPYDHKLGGKGISAGLLAIQVLDRGEPLGNYVDATKEFEAVQLAPGSVGAGADDEAW